MRYHYEPKENYSNSKYARLYRCPHPLFTRCTLYERDGVGVAVIQARFNPRLKIISWSEVDPWLADDIYNSDRFEKFFAEHSDFPDKNGIYPTYPVRKVMWELRMMPLRREFWENW